MTVGGLDEEQSSVIAGRLVRKSRRRNKMESKPNTEARRVNPDEDVTGHLLREPQAREQLLRAEGDEDVEGHMRREPAEERNELFRAEGDEDVEGHVGVKRPPVNPTNEG